MLQTGAPGQKPAFAWATVNGSLKIKTSGVRPYDIYENLPSFTCQFMLTALFLLDHRAPAWHAPKAPMNRHGKDVISQGKLVLIGALEKGH